jgi:hypothetical protein
MAIKGHGATDRLVRPVRHGDDRSSFGDQMDAGGADPTAPALVGSWRPGRD